MGLSKVFTVYSIYVGKVYKDDVCHIIYDVCHDGTSNKTFPENLSFLLKTVMAHARSAPT
jgi:hypothetical protein